MPKDFFRSVNSAYLQASQGRPPRAAAPLSASAGLSTAHASDPRENRPGEEQLMLGTRLLAYGLASQASEVVEFGTSNGPVPDLLDLGYPGRVKRKDPLDPDAV